MVVWAVHVSCCDFLGTTFNALFEPFCGEIPRLVTSNHTQARVGGIAIIEKER